MQKATKEQRAFPEAAVLCCVGLSLCLVARDMPQFLALATLSGSRIVQYATAFGRAAVLIALAVFVAAHKKPTDAFSATARHFCAGALASGILQAAGLSVLVAGAEDVAQATAGALLLGFGQSGLVCSWALWLLRENPYEMLRLCFFSCIAAGCMEMALAAMNASAVFALSLAIPAASSIVACACAMRGSLPAYHVYKRARRLNFDSRLALYLAALFVCSFTVRQITDTWMPQSDAGSLFLFEAAGGMGTALTAALAFAGMKMSRHYRLSGAFLVFAVPAIVASAYLSSFLTGPLSAAYLLPLFVARKFLLLASLMCAINYRSGRDRYLVFCCSMGAVELGNILQTAVTGVLGLAGAAQEVATPIIVAVSLIALCAIPAAIVFTSNGKQTPQAEKSTEDQLKEAREKALAQLADEFGLTAREREVLGYLNMGRNADYISKALYVAHSTAKSHIAHIYQKTGMNSQQRIMDDIEGRMKAIMEERPTE